MNHPSSGRRLPEADLLPLHLTYTKRWVVAPMIRESSVAEHTYRVMVIARYLARMVSRSLIISDLHKMDMAEVMEEALTHDWGEETSGDIPGPNKPDQYPEKNRVQSIVKVADALETGSWWVIWGSGLAWGNHPYNMAPQRDIDKVVHYSKNVPGLIDVARLVWKEITGMEMRSWE